MTLRVARGTVSHAKEFMTVVLQLSSRTKPALVEEVLREAAADIRNAYGPENDLCIAGPLPVQGGHVLVFSRGWGSPANVPGQEPAIVQEVAEHLGLDEGVISIAPKAKVAWARAEHAGEGLWRTARGYLYGVLQQPFGTAPRGVPREMIEVSLRWLRARSQPDKPVVLLINGSPIPTDWDNVEPLVQTLTEDRLVLVMQVLADDPTHPRYSHHPPPTVVLTASTEPTAAWIEAGQTDADVVAAMEAMREHASTALSVEWAGVGTGLEGKSGVRGRFGAGEVIGVRHEEDGGHAAAGMPDIAVPDAFWWQILGPGHIQRLGTPSTLPANAAPLGDGQHYEVTLGEPDQWLADNPTRDQVRAQARKALAPLLLPKDEMWRIAQDRFVHARENDTSGYWKHPPPPLRKPASTMRDESS